MNTPKHMALQDALGFRRPVYAHVPIVMNLDGTKMSKRDKHKAVRTRVQEWLKSGKWTRADLAGAAGIDEAAAARWLDRADVEMDGEQLARVAAALDVTPPEIEVYDFRRAGYLPETVLNFIALVGWSPGEDREKMTLDEMVSLFSIERIGRTSARFDREKLLAFNTDACAAATPARLMDAFRDYARLSRSPMAGLDDATLSRALEACRGLRTFHDVDVKVGVLFAPDDAVKYEPDAVRKVLARHEGRGYAMLEALLPALETFQPWTAESTDTSIKSFCESRGAKLADAAQPLRVALTGRTISPAIGETLALIGREAALRRVRRCLAMRTRAAGN